MPGERALHLTKDIVLPLGVILTMVTFAFQFGGWKAEKDTVIANTAALASATAASMQALSRDVLKMDTRLDALDHSQQRTEKALWLLRDYTEGRISRVPYRPTGGVIP